MEKTVKKKSVTLAKFMKDKLIRKALNDNFKDNLKIIENLISSSVRELFIDQFRNKLDLMHKLPAHYFQVCTYADVFISGVYVGTYDFEGTISPYYYMNQLKVKQNHTLEELLNKKKNVIAESDNLESDLKIFLSKINTTKQLYDQWPEARSIIDFETEEIQQEKTVSKKSPVSNKKLIKSINETLGLNS